MINRALSAPEACLYCAVDHVTVCIFAKKGRQWRITDLSIFFISENCDIMSLISYSGEIVKKCFYVAFAIAALLLTGCRTPKTPEQYREAVRSYPMGTTVETLNVDRSLSEVTKDFRERAPKCLNVDVTSTFWNGSFYQTELVQYHATVVENPEKTELYVQNKQNYIMVIDAVPVEKDKTEVTLYRSSFGYDLIASAVRGWATGENLGCPAFTQ